MARVRSSAPSFFRRRALLIALVALSLGWKLVVVTLGAALPRWLIDDGISALPAASQSYASTAKMLARGAWNRPIEQRALVQRIRVLSVDSTSHPLASSCGGLTARVRAYTYFAIPYSDVRVTCDSAVVEYRLFRRRHSGIAN
jgi:hypothetical protein